jgi:hypothetical protein
MLRPLIRSQIKNHNEYLLWSGGASGVLLQARVLSIASRNTRLPLAVRRGSGGVAVSVRRRMAWLPTSKWDGDDVNVAIRACQ